MPPKRASPSVDPPSASSSSEEEEEEEEEGEEEGEGEEEEEEEERTDPKSFVKKPTTKPDPTPSRSPQPQYFSYEDEDDDDEESDSESASDSDPLPPKPKPMDDTPKPTKKPVTTPTKPPTAAKRQLETDKAEKDSKRRKKKVGDADEEDDHLEKKSGDDTKKLFQRLWSEDDEIVILKGMVDYMKKGCNPTADLNAFLDFIKQSLHVDVNRDQLLSKIRRLRKKFQNNARRSKMGENPTFSKPHELNSYELSKKIWSGNDNKAEGAEANNIGGDSAVTVGKSSKSRKASNAVSPKTKAHALPEISPKVEPKAEEERNASTSLCLNELMLLRKNLTMPPSCLGESLLKKGLSSIESSKAKELEERWSNLLVEETELYLKRVELVLEQTNLVLNKIKSSKS